MDAIAIEVLYTTAQRLEKEEEDSLTQFGWGGRRLVHIRDSFAGMSATVEEWDMNVVLERITFRYSFVNRLHKQSPYNLLQRLSAKLANSADTVTQICV